MSSLTCCTTARSCEMNSRAIPSLPLQADDQVQHLGLHRDIQRRNRFVSDQELGVQRQCPGDADALTLATGKLVRIAMRGPCIEPHDIKQFIHALLTFCGYTHLMHVQRLAHGLPDASPRTQRPIWILEYSLYPLPVSEHLLPIEAREVGTGEHNLPGGGFLQAQQHATEGGFAAAGFAHQSQRAARMNHEAHIVDRFQFGDDAAEQAAMDREVLAEAAHLDQRRRIHLPAPSG